MRLITGTAEETRLRLSSIDILPHVGVKALSVGLATARLHAAAVTTRVQTRLWHTDVLK